MRRLIISLLLLVPLYIIEAQTLNVETVDAGISGATMRSVLNTNFSNIKMAVDLKAPLSGSAPGLTAGSAATVTGFNRNDGTLTLIGAHVVTLTTTGTTNVTLPTTGTLMTNPMTASGDLIYGGVSGVPTRLAAGTDGHVLTLSSGVPVWATPPASGNGGSMTYPGAGIAVSTGSAWTTSITDNSSNWNTAYGWGDHSLANYINSLAATSIAEGVLNNALEDAPIGVAVEDVVGGTTGRDRYMSPQQIYNYVSQHGGNGGSFGGGERIKFTIGDPGAPAADDNSFAHSALTGKQIDLFRKGVKSEYTYSSGSITVPEDWEADEDVELWLWPSNTWEYLSLETSIEQGLINSLIGYWKLDEGTGGTAVDEMGTQNLNVYSAASAWTTGIIGNGIAPSADVVARAPENSDLIPTGAFSISIWFNLDSLPTEKITDPKRYFLYSVLQNNPKTTNAYIRINYESPYENLIEFLFRNPEPGSDFYVRSDVAVTKNAWHHVVASFPGSEGYMKIYLNGVDVTDTDVIGSIAPSNSYVHFGSWERYSSHYVRGVIDEPMYFNRGLTLEEAQFLYNDGDGRQLTIE